jgi:hypothetical protein
VQSQCSVNSLVRLWVTDYQYYALGYCQMTYMRWLKPKSGTIPPNALPYLSGDRQSGKNVLLTILDVCPLVALLFGPTVGTETTIQSGPQVGPIVGVEVGGRGVGVEVGGRGVGVEVGGIGVEVGVAVRTFVDVAEGVGVKHSYE